MALSDLYMGDLLLKLITHETGNVSYVTYRAQKPVFPTDPADPQAFPRALPEAQGLSHTFVRQLISRLHEDPACKMHKLMIVKDGACIAEEQFGPYPLNHPHVTHSMCKSITGMAVGLLIAEGKLSLEDNVFDLFEQQRGLFDLLKPRDLTVRHLLTMTSGVQFNEAGVLTGDDWKKGFLQSGFNFTPGTDFEYNSMNSYMLSAIITLKTGMTMAEYLRTRLFEPMGVTSYLWEESPQGITKGGWGMYLRIEDMCKMGQLYLQEGAWNGKQLVPADWVRESVRVQAQAAKGKTGDGPRDDYGYHLWTSTDRAGAFTYNGMLGQNVYCYPDVQMIIATNAANDDVFQSGRMSSIIRGMMKEQLDDALIPKVYLSGTKSGGTGFSRNASFPEIKRGGWGALETRLRHGSGGARVHLALGARRGRRDALLPEQYHAGTSAIRDALLKALDGTVYDTDMTGVGFLPLLVQVFRINFTKGIHAIGFRYTPEKDFYIDLYEGEQIISLLCNFAGTLRPATVDVNDEFFLVTTKSGIMKDAAGNLVFSNKICFADESSMRRIDFHFTDLPLNPLRMRTPASFRVQLNEDPGSAMLIQSMKTVSSDKGSTGRTDYNNPVDLLFDGTKALFKESLRQLGAIDSIKRTIGETVAPTFTATLRKDATVSEAEVG